ncbi:MAG: Hint domain-containing protein [Pseudomonadota bacterium]
MVEINGSDNIGGTNQSAVNSFDDSKFWYQWVELTGTIGDLSDAGFDTSNGTLGAGQTVYNAGGTDDLDALATNASAAVLGNDGERFGFRVTTVLRVENAGTYTFSVRSDDGVRGYADGVEFFNDDSVHAPRTRTDTVFLSAGDHEITFIYFENTGQNVLEVDIQGPDYPTLTPLQDADVQVNRGDDIVSGEGGADFIEGGDGNDELSGNGGADEIDGGAGDDIIDGGSSGDTIRGGIGEDTIDGGGGGDDIDGGDDNDTIEGGGGGDTIAGGDGDDIIEGEGGADIITGGTGEDTIDGGNANDDIDGGSENDTIRISRGSDTVDGGTGSDTYTFDAGTIAADTETLTVIVDDAGDGSAAKTNDGSTDTLTSVEIYIADEAGAEADSITLTTTVTDRSTVLNLDDSAVGVFTPTNVAFAPTSFGGAGEPTFSEVLGLRNEGTFVITAGDESGTIGEITFTNFETISFDVVCFTTGTMILTESGERPVESLAEGDLVWTQDHGLQPLRWVGATSVPATRHLAPVLIEAGALGNARPLLVSQQHRILLSGMDALCLFGEAEVLAPAKHLVDGDRIRILSGGVVTYHHLRFDRHEIVRSNGVLSESLHPAQSVPFEFFEGADIIPLLPRQTTARLPLRGFEARVLMSGRRGASVRPRQALTGA